MRGRHRHAELGESKDRKHGANVHAPPAARSVMAERERERARERERERERGERGRERKRERERERDGEEAGRLCQYLYFCTSSKASELSTC